MNRRSLNIWKSLAACLVLVLAVPQMWAGEGTSYFLLYPDVKADSTATGIAVANPSGETVLARLFFLDDAGNLIAGPGVTNPALRTINPNSQLAETPGQLFGNVGNRRGFVLLLADNIAVVGFFLTFSGDVSRIDGAEAIPLDILPDEIVFPEIFAAAGESTQLSVVVFDFDDTPSSSLTFELHGAQGVVETRQFSVTDGPFVGIARFSRPIEQIFTGPIPNPGFVLVRSPNGLIVGYEEFGTAKVLGGRNALSSTIARDLPFALFGAQAADTAGIQTTVSVINPTDEPSNAKLSAFVSGVSTGVPVAMKSVVIPAGGMVKGDLRTLVGLPAGDFVGWLRIDSNITGLVGDLTYGDRGGNFLSSVQLQPSPVREVVYSHVADGLGFFTGLTFLNISPDPSSIEIEVLNVQGQQTGTATLTLQPFEHRPRTLLELVPGLTPQVGGFIRVQSELDIFQFELFGYVPTGSLVGLSAVPPQRGNGLFGGQITPAFAGSAFPASVHSPGTPALEFPRSRARGVDLSIDHDFVPGEAVVRFTSDLQAFSALAAAGVEIAATGPDQVVLMKMSEGTSVAAAAEPEERVRLAKQETLDLIEALNSRSDVLYAEPNYIYQPYGVVVPNDPLYDLQWHYPFIGLDEAWNTTKGSNNCVVTVVDTGAKFSHPDLGPRLTGGQMDFISDPQRALDGDGVDGNADDPGDDPTGLNNSYHGTHVAGTIGAVSNNGSGVTGINWVSPLMTLRALGAGGGTGFDIYNAVLYAARLSNSSGQLPAQRACVLNMSLGGSVFSQFAAESVTAALEAGVVVVAAAGNENTDSLRYPASYDGVISVGSVGASAEKAPYSNFGSRVDVVAPGGDVSVDFTGDGLPDGVLSTLWSGSNPGAPDFDFYQGTSMAAPHVAGLASLMKSVNLGLTPAQVRSILQNTAIDLGAAGKDNTFGFGLIDAVAALAAAGNQPIVDPRLIVTPTTLNFGNQQTELESSIENGGGGVLVVSSATPETDSGGSWLTASLPRAGVLRVNVLRAALPDGDYRGRVRLQSNGGSAVVEVFMSVGGTIDMGIGDVFIIALDPRTFESITTAEATFDQDYLYTSPPTPAGAYIILAGTDRDEDGFICDEGEFCGAYPISNRPELVPVQPSLLTGGVDFLVEPDSDVSAAHVATVQGVSYRRLQVPLGELGELIREKLRGLIQEKGGTP